MCLHTCTYLCTLQLTGWERYLQVQVFKDKVYTTPSAHQSWLITEMYMNLMLLTSVCQQVPLFDDSHEDWQNGMNKIYYRVSISSLNCL